MRTRATRGFTLIEAMLVVTLIGLLATLAFTGLQGMRPRVDVNAQLGELSAAVSNAQASALSTGGRAVVVVYESTGTDTVAKAGGWLLYEDPQSTFDLSALTVDAHGQPTSVPGAGVRLVEQVRFGVSPYDGKVRVAMGTGGAFTLNAPFSGSASVCSFCSDAGGGLRRGAIIFGGGGEARFVDSDGAPTGASSGVVMLSSTSARGALAVAGATGFSRVTKP